MPCRAQVVAFDVSTQLYEIQAESPDCAICRSLRDLQSLARQQKQHRAPLPLQAAHKLQSRSWRVEGEGWHANQKKAIASLGFWLTELLNAADPVARLWFVDEASYQRRQQELRERVEREAPARKLQQYFASAENMSAMTDLLKQTLLNASEGSALTTATTIVEPSFGDGRLLEAVLGCVTAMSTAGATVRVVGVEIDPVVSAAAENLLGLARSSLPSHVELGLHIGDFLLTTREQLSGSYDGFMVVVGSPPYTAGGGTGSLSSAGSAEVDTGRNLPLNFLVHSATALRANVVIFLMPQRCSREAFVSRALLEMRQSSGVEYVLKGQQEASSEFEFVGRKVSQPAVIQVYCIA